MARITWDEIGKHLYETGVDHVVLYKPNDQNVYTGGVAWNGVSAITESPSGADSNPIYADNIKYLDLRSAEEFGATVECYTYPPEFAECNGEAIVATGVVIGQQTRKTFGLSYRTIVGNDVKGNDYGYKLHLIYGATASPSEKAYNTVNDSPEAGQFSFELTTTPVAVRGYKNTASLTIDTSLIEDKTKITALETLLYGGDSAEATLPTPETV
ncbi:MAG: hypothetical protein II477_03960, partial [Lachnospiraceae bacterium]|nr:hypothetical protein [Lachnospiraceae bacterium]